MIRDERERREIEKRREYMRDEREDKRRQM